MINSNIRDYAITKKVFLIVLILATSLIVSSDSLVYGQLTTQNNEQVAYDSSARISAYVNTINNIRSQVNRYMKFIAEGLQAAASRQDRALRNATLLDAKKIIAAVDVDNLIVIDMDDALLICKKDQSQNVKHVVDYLERKEMDEYL